ncbi:MAG: glutaminyl-peptide cyclotransferase [Planctomycetota bacterium]
MGFSRRILPRVILALSVTPLVCSRATSNTPNEPNVYGYKVLHTYPHDKDAFTQGLVFDNGVLYEGTGGYGTSTLRKVQLETGKVLQLHKLPQQLFGEGVAVFGDRIIQLTWKAKTGFVYDKKTFAPIRTFNYETQGWGITHDNKRLIMSDGTSNITFLDPNTFKVTGQLKVHDNNTPVMGINELEYIDGKIYANIWPTNRIAIIAPDTGKITAWIDLKGKRELKHRVDVLNGIAYDKKNKRLFVTGKWWPKLFHIQVTPPK